MSFNKLLRKSRLSQVKDSNTLTAVRLSKLYPSQQIIETGPASFYRKDFGLKSKLPSKVNKRYVVVDKLDTIEHMTEFEAEAGFYWNKLRFQEFNIPLETRNGKNPLFFGNTRNIPRNQEELNTSKISEVLNLDESTPTSKKIELLEILKNYRGSFLKFLSDKNPEKLIRIKSGLDCELHDEITQFIFSLKEEESPALKKPICNLATDKINGTPIMKGTGGFSYRLKGKLTTSPNGFSEGSVVPARLISSVPSHWQIAVGGLVAAAPHQTMNSLGKIAANNPGKHLREAEIPVSVQKAVLSSNGAIRLEVAGVDSKNGVKVNYDNSYSSRPNYFERDSKNTEISAKNILELLNKET
ncbi:hypothetical protein PACTADRAFT_32576 [Pachysolen tannophilus NRRL Y-2460]|uniref:Uncharacterized protein n=1 Tax=Pachysolen tannophilus NRRL Y-2460 TaxID=669874 RepID=A0A1E4TZA7_PACTA|nr:hypothetical protein PACTADRAFT_32576 [Pachysolen tannophilus NRRL Y-2460]